MVSRIRVCDKTVTPHVEPNLDFFLISTPMKVFMSKKVLTLKKVLLKDKKQAKQIPEALSAFRTITTMLSYIQSIRALEAEFIQNQDLESLGQSR